MSAIGTFDIDMQPQQDPDAPVGRIVLSKTYSGGMTGSAVGQMISKRIDGGAAAYYAIEEFSGSVDGRSGAFTLLHRGYMDADGMSLDVTIMPGSGTEDLATIHGTMEISQDASGHRYELKYQL